MTTPPRDTVAVAHQTMMLNNSALKQLAAMFDRIALLSVDGLLSIPHNPLDPYLGKVLAWLVEAGIGFAPKLEKLKSEQIIKDRFFPDIDELYKPYGLGAEDLMASRNDPEKAAAVKNQVNE